MTLDKLITRFLEYMEIERGRSVLSVANYDHYLRNFAAFAKEKNKTDPKDISKELVRQYRLFLNRSDLSKNTQNYYLIALRSFLKYLAKIDVETLAPEKIELSKVEERQITFLTDDELDDLLRQPDLTTIQGLRDKAILTLFFSTGLRVSELSNLKITDVNLEKQEFSIKGKGGKIRVVFLDEAAREAIDAYLRARADKSEYLFIGYGHTNDQTDNGQLTTDNGITPRSIQRMIKKYTLLAGITKDVTPHTMRHSFATDLLMSGADLRAVQSLLGHSSVTTTQIYTHVTDQHLKDIHDAFHGLRRTPKNEKE